jgi:hypothetical protein
MRSVEATEYLSPLREGGSLPGIVRADDGGRYVVKFRGAGQGAKMLIAELISGEIARALGFNVPELVLIELDPRVGQSEPDAEIQDLLQFSAGLNLGMTFLPHALPFSKLLVPDVSTEFASRLVWFDAYVTNVDRTPRNVNMLVKDQDIWLIDHGASLYFQHNWNDHIRQSETPFPMVKDHVLLPEAAELAAADTWAKTELTPDIIHGIVELIPDAWLEPGRPYETAAEYRQAYGEFLLHRLEHSAVFVKEAEDARA